MSNYKNLDDGSRNIIQNKFKRDEIIEDLKSDFNNTKYTRVADEELLEYERYWKKELSTSESFLVGYDKGLGDHTILTVVSVEGINYKLVNSFVGEKAENMYKLLMGTFFSDKVNHSLKGEK